jgi:hypothetical protein
MTAPPNRSDMMSHTKISFRLTGNGRGQVLRPLLLGVLAVSLFSGCAQFQLPSMAAADVMAPGSLTKKTQSPFAAQRGSAGDLALPADGSMTMEAYQRIKEAKSRNAVVLQVEGDSEPIRVLPLPPQGEKSVFVSELLTQTGVLKKLGLVEATLYRASAGSLTGIRMKINFNDSNVVDPVTDYALRPGDRLQVRKKVNTGLQALIDLALRR